MPRTVLFLLLILLAGPTTRPLTGQVQEDVISTGSGDLAIAFVGHGTLYFTFGDLVVHVDPVGREGDYTSFPDADLILVTHEHGDHLDPEAVAEIRRAETAIVVSESCADRLEGARIMGNGDRGSFHGIGVEAVPAYNLEHTRPDGRPFHPKGAGNGYVISFGDFRVYVAGDTENTPEMKALQDIDVAFLPMNLPYTMTPDMVANAAKAFRPRILYPYHFGDTDTNELLRLLGAEEGIEVRIRDLG